MSPAALNRRQAAELPWYEACRAYHKRADIRSAAKAIDEELLWRFQNLPECARPLQQFQFPRTDFGRVSWNMAWGRYQPRCWDYLEGDDFEGFLMPASNLSLPDLPFDAVPIHVAYMLDIDSIEEIDDGFEIFGGLKHETEIYFLEGSFSGLIKIGIASNLSGRVASIQSGSPEPLSLICHLPGNKKLEKFLHGLFEPLHSHGEWFYPHWSIKSVIMGLSG